MAEQGITDLKKYLYEMITNANKMTTIFDKLDDDVAVYQLDPQEEKLFAELYQSMRSFVMTSRNVLKKETNEKDF